MSVGSGSRYKAPQAGVLETFIFSQSWGLGIQGQGVGKGGPLPLQMAAFSLCPPVCPLSSHASPVGSGLTPWTSCNLGHLFQGPSSWLGRQGTLDTPVRGVSWGSLNCSCLHLKAVFPCVRSLCVSSPLLVRSPVIGLGAHLRPVRPGTPVEDSCKDRSPNSVTFQGSGWMCFWRDLVQVCRGILL